MTPAQVIAASQPTEAVPTLLPDLIYFLYVWYARWRLRLMPDPKLAQTVLDTVMRHYRERNWWV